jgi:3-deoxy-D-manno-octulosonic-acid transferase
MTTLYNIIISIYWLAILIASLFNKKAAKFIKGRNNLFSNLKQAPFINSKIVWFHAASLGEFEQGRPVIESFRNLNPEYKILLTFFSPSGYEIRNNYKGADYICYLPLDLSWLAERFIKIVNPSAVYFIKYEFWYNYIRILNRQNIKVYCFSANFRANQIFFKWYGSWYRKILQKFTRLFVQNQLSKDLLASIGINKVTISGDTRFDRVYHLANQIRHLPEIERFKNNHRLIIAGSTWPSDEEYLVQFINQCNGDCRFIIAPHEIEPVRLDQITASLDKKVLKFSEAAQVNIEEYDVLLIDNIGMLSSVYQYGSIAYIGGGFGKGIHNVLEAATFGLPVVFGPNYHKFREAEKLIESKGAFSINSFDTLKNILDKFLTDPDFIQTASQICKQYIADNTGATEIILSKTLTSETI